MQDIYGFFFLPLFFQNMNVQASEQMPTWQHEIFARKVHPGHIEYLELRYKIYREAICLVESDEAKPYVWSFFNFTTKTLLPLSWRFTSSIKFIQSVSVFMILN